MKVYYHPASTTSRPIMLFANEEKANVEFQVVDLFKGEHYKDEYLGINPNRMVPVLEDGDFRLTESSAILKYLAEKLGSAAYPPDLKERARVNERMDWINTQLCRDLAYNLVYPQIFPTHKRQSEEGQAATLAWGCERSKRWLEVLDKHILGSNRFLCGDRITIADYFAVAFVTLGEVVGADYTPYPNVRRWVAEMKKLPSWRQVNEVFDGYAASLKGSQFVSI